MNEDNAGAAMEAARTAAEAAARSSEAAQAATAAAQAATQAADASMAASQAADAAGHAAMQADALAVAASAATAGAIDPTIFRLAIFVLAIFVGYYVVWSVTPALHTPLMSVTNAISSVIVVGALLATGVSFAEADGALWAKIFGFFALILASVNIFGGFLVTQRMLAMYKKKR
ncbi:NAD(P) transhydrogenase subunit PntAB [Stappia sp. 22II-S9-Z10]|nr:NAD(P) transhydrogenase subunit PntAB [Stappia sp. 22II-S9-Z10]